MKYILLLLITLNISYARDLTIDEIVLSILVERTKEKKAESIINKNKKIKEDSESSSVNENFAKIQNIVYKYFYPPQNSQGNTVKAVIKLGALGKILDWRILRYSSSIDLNNECDQIK